MKFLYAILGIGWLYNQIIHLPERLEFISQLNYLTLVLIGYGLYVLKHLGRVYFTGEGRIFSFDFFCQSLWILGLALGLPWYIEYLLKS